jgi:hypothetical protein
MVAIHRNQWRSMPINGTHLRPDVLEQAINGNQWQSMAINAINGSHLRPNVLEQVINVGLDKRVAHH